MSPRYDFECETGHITEQFAGYDDRIIECPTCRKDAPRVVLQAPGVVYKSDGFTTRAEVPYPETDSQKAEQQGELKTALSKRGWDKSRAFEETKKAMITDEKGNKSLDRSKIPATVDKHGC